MKKHTLLIFSLILFITVSGSCQSHNNRVTIKGHATFTAVYKGGARPSPEVLEACCSKRPMANATLYLKKNYYSRLQCTITTDKNGDFQKRLRPGKYNVFLKNERNDKKANDLSDGKVDNTAVRKTAPYFILEIAKSSNISFEIDILERVDFTQMMVP